jgi:hypothetical protein
MVDNIIKEYEKNIKSNNFTILKNNELKEINNSDIKKILLNLANDINKNYEENTNL